tara:strand:- start:263 stop:454 length:192 start_codon:yes stop_codon:yes gene_type:complete
VTRRQKLFHHLNKSPVNDYEIYMIVMLYTYQHKSLEYLAHKFKVSTSVVKEVILRSRFGGACG